MMTETFFISVIIAAIGIWVFVRHQFSERFEITKHTLDMMLRLKEGYFEQLKEEQAKNALLIDRAKELIIAIKFFLDGTVLVQRGELNPKNWQKFDGVIINAAIVDHQKIMAEFHAKDA